MQKHRHIPKCLNHASPPNAKWAAMGKCSADTALRDINDLLERGVLRRLEGGGRSTGYDLCAK